MFTELLTPLTIAFVGFLVQRTLAAQSRGWKLQDRLADKRVEIYERIAEDLNKIFCYVEDVGDFRDETPGKIIAAKRNVDRQMFMYQAIWPEDTFKAFTDYIDSAFEHYQGVGMDAKIRTTKFEKQAATELKGQTWLAAWDVYFMGRHDPEHKRKHQKLIGLISRDLVMNAPRRAGRAG